MTQLTEEQREHVINDIRAYKVEETKAEISHNQLMNYKTMLQEMDDKELIDQWHGTVGEWLISRNKEFDPKEELQKVKDGEEPDYGYSYFK